MRNAATTPVSCVHAVGFFPGHTIEGVATAVVYATARIFEVPRSLAAVARVAHVDEVELRRTYLNMVQACGLEVPPPRTMSYLPALASGLGVSDETRRGARALLDVVAVRPALSGRNPVGVAAMTIYVASCVTAERVT